MFKGLFLFPKTGDTSEVEAFVDGEFLPAFKGLRGLHSFTGSAGALLASGDPPFVRVVEAMFESLEAAQAAVESAAGDAEREGVRRFHLNTLLYEVRDL